MNTPCSWSIENVSRALWPIASTTWLVAIVSPPSNSTARTERVPSLLVAMSSPSDLRSETVFPTQCFYFGADAFNDRHQTERADMGLVVPQDFLRPARGDKFAQNFAAEIARLLHPAVQLPVGERSGATFTELRIALWDQHAAPP